MHINAHSQRIKQKALEHRVLSQTYKVVRLAEKWWDNLHNWGAAVNGLY